MSVSGKRIFITGGTKGIGLAAARLLATRGATVYIVSRHRDNLDKALADIGNGAKGAILDMSDLPKIRSVVDKAAEEMGGIDMLISDAGVGGGSVSENKLEEWKYVLNANLLGCMECCSAAIPHIQENNEGRILLVGSMSAKIAEEGSDVYVATKAGIRGFGDSLGKTLADKKIAVTVLEPGLIATELTEEDRSKRQKQLEEMTMIKPEAVASAIEYVLSQPAAVSIPFLQIRPLCQKI